MSDFKFNISPSALSTFEYCERWFYYAYIEKPEIQRFVSKYAEFGTCVHAVLENKDFNNCQKYFEEFELGKFSYNVSQVQKCVDFGKMFYDNYLSQNLVMEGKFDFLYKFDNGVHCKLKGFVDCYDNEKAAVIDWKTSTYSPQKVKDYRKQITLYALFKYLRDGIMPEIGYVVFVKEKRIDTVKFTKDMILQCKKDLEDTLLKIKSKKVKSDFKINPKIHIYNDYREFVERDLYEKDLQIEVVYNTKILQIRMDPFDPMISKVMEEQFSYEMDGANFMVQIMKQRGVEFDGYKKLWNDRNKTLPVGFLKKVKELMNFYKEYKNGKVDIIYKDISENPQYKEVNLSKNSDINLREYQEKVVGDVLK